MNKRQRKKRLMIMFDKIRESKDYIKDPDKVRYYGLNCLEFKRLFPSIQYKPLFQLGDYIMPKHVLKQKDSLFLEDGSPNYILFEVTEGPIFRAGYPIIPLNWGGQRGWHYKGKVVIHPNRIDSEISDRPFYLAEQRYIKVDDPDILKGHL